MRRHMFAFLIGAAFLGTGASCGSTEPLGAQMPGPQGPSGPQGPQGPAGPQGSAGPGMNLDATLGCPAGEKPIGGGVQHNTSPRAVVTTSYP